MKGPACEVDVFISTKYCGMQTSYYEISFPFSERGKIKVNFGSVMVTFHYPTKKILINCYNFSSLISDI